MFTEFDPHTDTFRQVEEPDPSLEYTYADYLKWRFEERVELIRGQLMKMTAPNRKHQEISVILSTAFRNYLRLRSCKIYTAPFDVRLPRTEQGSPKEIVTVVQPDLCVVCDLHKLDEKGCLGAPDLVVEILSPGNSRKEVRIKFELYEEAGVKEYWIVNPEEQNIAVFALEKNGRYGGARLFATGDSLAATAVPGFVLDITELFPTE
ncbi:MAG TPA: Uma2 family endonuclease [Lacibacter sp.]|nr:Uma2 family endonuclease [Lacibacter sp.]HMO90035.1 Uma2 family endonuclease [Lacibacter sp.]HMP87218.1 Uma2 family endonuclease [Lacibacter sp.]